MAIRVASWNIEGRLSKPGISKRGTPERIIRNILALKADIVFLPEAYGEYGMSEHAMGELEESGYEYHVVAYENGGGDREEDMLMQPHMMIISRLRLLNIKRLRLGDIRNNLVVEVADPSSGRQLRIIGVHLDDRNEANRLQQAPELIDFIRSSTLPTILLGDFNAMHGTDLFPAKLLRSRSAKAVSKLLIPSLSVRAIEMAQGKVISLIEAQTGLRDADPRHRPTATPKTREHEWLPSIRLIQIDHMFVSQTITVKKFRISRDGGADHRAISATIF